jgi:hypothetical protein
VRIKTFIICFLYNTALKSGRLIGGLALCDIEWKFPFHDRGWGEMASLPEKCP